MLLQGDREAGSSRAVGVDNTARRTYDLEEFRAQAAKRELDEEELDGLTALEVKKLKRISVLSQILCLLHIA